jgi:hypothetical protein
MAATRSTIAKLFAWEKWLIRLVGSLSSPFRTIWEVFPGRTGGNPFVGAFPYNNFLSMHICAYGPASQGRKIMSCNSVFIISRATMALDLLH